jgi:hypothetical protein
MLKYHLILPCNRQHNDSFYVHYLDLGSHLSPYHLPPLISFSKVTLCPKTKLPTITLKKDIMNIVLPLEGLLKIDDVLVDCKCIDIQKYHANCKDIGVGTY